MRIRRWSGARRLAAAAGAVVATASMLVAVAAPARAAQANVRLSSTSVAPTGTFSLRATGFGAGETADLAIDYVNVTSQLMDAAGSAGPVSLNPPPGAALGRHTITVTGRATGRAATATFSISANWPQAGYDSGHSGYNPFETRLTPSTVRKLQVAWHSWGETAEAASSAVSDGMIYLGSGNGRLSAFSTTCATGGASCTPAWIAQAGDAHSSDMSSPAVADGVVYVGIGDGLYAYPAKCGTGGAVCGPLWHSQTGLIFRSDVTVADGVVYIAATDGTLYAYPANCGTGNAVCTPLWHAALGSNDPGSPAVADGIVYAIASWGVAGAGGYESRLYAYPAACGTGNATCRPLWHASLTSIDIYLSPVVSRGVVYVAPNRATSGGGTDRALYAFPARCGSGDHACTPLWHAANAAASYQIAPPAVGGGIAYVGTGDGQVYAYPAKCGAANASCQPLWQATVDSSVAVQPSIAGGLVYVVTASGTVYAFRARCATGGALCTPVWTWAMHYSGGASSANIVDGRLYVGTVLSRVYAFALPPGSSS